MENEDIQDVEQELPPVEEGDEDTTDWKARAVELEQKAIKQRERTKELKAKLSKYETQTPIQKESNEPDYARLAYLENKGITHPEDQKIVQDEAERLKLPLTDILGMSHIKAQLETAKEQREALSGMPKGRGKGGGQTQHEVDYWIDRQKPDGTYDTPEDPQLAIKVIDARIKKQNQANQFSDVMYTG